MLSFGVAGGYLGYGGDRFGLILLGRQLEVDVGDRGPRRRSGGVCEYLERPGAMVVAVFGAGSATACLPKPLSSAVFPAAIDRSDHSMLADPRT